MFMIPLWAKATLLYFY